jgi:hypothetical protein
MSNDELKNEVIINFIKSKVDLELFKIENENNKIYLSNQNKITVSASYNIDNNTCSTFGLNQSNIVSSAYHALVTEFINNLLDIKKIDNIGSLYVSNKSKLDDLEFEILNIINNIDINKKPNKIIFPIKYSHHLLNFKTFNYNHTNNENNRTIYLYGYLSGIPLYVNNNISNTETIILINDTICDLNQLEFNEFENASFSSMSGNKSIHITLPTNYNNVKYIELVENDTIIDRRRKVNKLKNNL